MNRDIHDRARELLSASERTGAAEEAWLEQHLAQCAQCRVFGEEVGPVVRALRSVPFAATPDLVWSTQRRVRLRARELQSKRERLWLVWISCALVSAFAFLSNALLWQAFAWLGRRAQVPAAVWEVGFAMFWIAPTIAASFLFLAHGTHLADRNGSAQG
jgi:predicted anti-sigma-YlaC factor YlaD